MDGLYFRSLLCTMHCTICSCEKVQHRSTVYHTLGAHIDRDYSVWDVSRTQKEVGKKKKERDVARRDQEILRRAVNRYTARLHRGLKRLFLDTQGYLRGICHNPKSQWRLLDEKQDWRKRAVLEVHGGLKDQWTLITVSITILEVPNCVAITEGGFSDWEGNTCDTVITQVLTYILLGIWLKLLLEGVSRKHSRVNKKQQEEVIPGFKHHVATHTIMNGLSSFSPFSCQHVWSFALNFFFNIHFLFSLYLIATAVPSHLQ